MSSLHSQFKKIENFKKLSGKQKLILVALTIFFFFLLWYVIGSTVDSISNYFFDRKVKRAEKAIEQKINEANKNENKADEWEKEREEKRAEYEGREPLRKKREIDSMATKRELEKARREYENRNTNSDGLTLDERELRAIEKARRLYPR